MDNRPNILFVMTDQQRGDCLSCEDHPVLLTPNMDSIAADGVWFSRFYSACPSCIAARRSILSGQNPATHGIVGREKFIWDTVEGWEQFFDLAEDPEERRNLIDDPGRNERIGMWRQRMVESLEGRPEGFVKNGQLTTVEREKLTSALPHAFESAERAREKCRRG